MSTIAVDNFKPSAGGTSFGIEGIAKAWGNLNGTGTISLRDSYNISSVTDSGTGRYDFSFTNNMADANYAVLFGGGVAGTDPLISVGVGTAPTSSGFRLAANDDFNEDPIDLDYANFGNKGALA